MPILNQIIFISLIIVAGAFLVNALWSLRVLLRPRQDALLNVSYGGIR